MRRTGVLLIAVALLGCRATPRDSQATQQALVASNAAAPLDARPCLARLGDASWSERERAMAELLTLGEAALPALRDHVEDPDPEVRWRVAWLLRAIPSPVQDAERTGPLARSETWRGTVRLTGSVVVTEGMTLAISPGCHVVMRDASCRIDVEGTLLAHGTPDGPIDIGPAGASAAGAWDGVKVEGDQASASLSHCRIHGARMAVCCLRGRVVLEDCAISDSTWGVYLNHPFGGLVRRCAFTDVRTPIAFPSPCPGVVFEANRISAR